MPQYIDSIINIKEKQNITGLYIKLQIGLVLFKQKYLKHLSVTNYQRDIVLQQL